LFQSAKETDMLVDALTALAADMELEYDEYHAGLIMYQSIAQLYVVGTILASGGR
jgi:hypothetical protein